MNNPIMFRFVLFLLSTWMTLTTSTFTSDDGIAQYYGKIIPDHHTTLPNIDTQGNNIHYLINNLPITQDGILNSWAALYHINPNVTGQSYDVILHVARPSDTTNPTALSRQVTYIQSIRLTNIQSGVPVSLLNYNIMLQSGDLIGVSVPNNAILLRVGFNDMGEAISYSAASVAPGSSDTSRIASFTIVDPTSNPLLQLCSAFDVLPYGMPLPSDQTNYYPGRTYHFIQPAVQQAGCITWFKVETMGGDPISLTLHIARQHSDGKYYIVPNTQYIINNLPSLIQYNITYGDFCVEVGDLVGYLDFDGDFMLAGALPDNQLVDQFYVSVNGGDPTAALLEYQRNYYPAYNFGVATPKSGSANGDPQFAGFQGQSFQFHGFADEHFNLISTPTMQLNAHFVYLASGICNYNNTLCFQHPGTYLDVLGFMLPSTDGHKYIKIVAGPHDKGLRIWIGNDTIMNETYIGDEITWIMNSDTDESITITYVQTGVVYIQTPLIQIKIVNSDYFFNLQLGLMNERLLHIGSHHRTITDKSLCLQNEQPGSHVIEKILNQKYHSTYPLHGLIGQTWRNVRVCGKHWVGSVQDYLVSDLFGSDYFYNYYKQ